MKLLITQSSPVPCHPSLLSPNTSLSTLFSNTLKVRPCSEHAQSTFMFRTRSKYGHVPNTIKVRPCSEHAQSTAMFRTRSKYGHVPNTLKVRPCSEHAQSTTMFRTHTQQAYPVLLILDTNSEVRRVAALVC
jgi:hypothetical protein